MRTVVVLAKNYTHIVSLVRYGCIFLFFMQFLQVLVVSQINLTVPVENNVFLIALGVIINAFATLIFYGVAVLYLKISLKDLQANRLRELRHKSKEAYS